MFEQKKDAQIIHKSFLHISTLDQSTKNPYGIIEACSLLKKEVDDFTLKIISDEDYSVLQKNVNSLGLENNISFLGPLDWNELPPHYHSASAFILFSEYESFSIVLAEAWATGTPVITTSVGIANNLPNSLGIKVDTNNTDALSEAMLTVIDGKHFDSDLIRNHAVQYGADV